MNEMITTNNFKCLCIGQCLVIWEKCTIHTEAKAEC